MFQLRPNRSVSIARQFQGAFLCRCFGKHWNVKERDKNAGFVKASIGRSISELIPRWCHFHSLLSLSTLNTVSYRQCRVTSSPLIFLYKSHLKQWFVSTRTLRDKLCPLRLNESTFPPSKLGEVQKWKMTALRPPRVHWCCQRCEIKGARKTKQHSLVLRGNLFTLSVFEAALVDGNIFRPDKMT